MIQEVDSGPVERVARQGRHLDVAGGIDPHERDGSPGIVWSDDPRSVDSLVDQHRPVDDFLPVERRVIPRVEIGDRARIGANAVIIKDVDSGAVALGIYHGSNN